MLRRVLFGAAVLTSLALQVSRSRLLASSAGDTPFSFVAGFAGTVGAAHGATATITKAAGGFGTKPQAAPIAYDDFQSLAANAQVATSAAAKYDVTQGFYKPAASTALLRPGTPYTKNMRSRWGGRISYSVAGDVSNLAFTHRNFQKAYIDVWWRADSSRLGAAKPQNIKILRLHQDNAGDPNAYFSAGPTVTPGAGEGSDAQCAGRDGATIDQSSFCDPSDLGLNGNLSGNAFTGSEFWDRWNHFQLMAEAGSDANANGTWILFVNGALRYNRPGNINLMRPGFSRWTEFYVGNYIRSEEWDGEVSMHWESLYVDNAWARVEVGDNANYAKCKHREIQIPTAWSDGSVSVTLNRGSFPSFAGLHLFLTPISCRTYNCAIHVGHWQ